MLNDLTIKAKKPVDKQYKLSDGKGLFLLVHPNGSKYWRLRYFFAGKEKLLALGVYPLVSLSKAREKRDQAKIQVSNGVDPGVLKQSVKKNAEAMIENSFESVAREWFLKHCERWAPSYNKKVIRSLELNVFPWLGKVPIAEITAPRLLEVLQRIEKRGALETAHRVSGICSVIFRYAIATGRMDRNPASDLLGAIPRPIFRHYSSITDPPKVGELMRAIDGYSGCFEVKCALRILSQVFVRPGELRNAEWSEINLEVAEWTIPAERMKMRSPHLVPLSRQVIEIFRELYPLTGAGRFIFCSPRKNTKPISENTLNKALKQIGYSPSQMTAHGFRAMARTILDEVLAFRPDIIEHQLAHAVKDPLGRAYNRTSHLEIRREMMQRWADYLDTLAKRTPKYTIPREMEEQGLLSIIPVFIPKDAQKTSKNSKAIT